ncbi:hypothetical protein [Venenivibrio stagnispumantis]|nr:hypothetical protein [Venenivibrio stagnispumantis]MCW4572602.1 hypothetical protein [Venenivibrio stagnispumantis]
MSKIIEIIAVASIMGFATGLYFFIGYNFLKKRKKNANNKRL